MPPGEAPLRAADCYRFVLGNPDVQVCMTGPADDAQLDEALSALAEGPLDARGGSPRPPHRPARARPRALVALSSRASPMFARASRRTRVLLRVALYGGFLFVGLPLAFSEAMIRGYRVASVPPARAPYEEAPLVSDGLRLRAWLARGRPEKPAVVIAHGLGDSLDSYLEHARVFQERGHTVLLVDMRAHGGSEGRHTTLGCRERARRARGRRRAAAQGSRARRHRARGALDGRRRGRCSPRPRRRVSGA